jgi:cytochrome c peroxidase
MRGLKATLTLALALSLTAIIRCFAAEDPLMKEAHGLFEPVPSDAPAFKDNPTSPAKVELGKMLYFDPRLSQSHNISC